MSIPESATNVHFTATCESDDVSDLLTTTSESFHVYPFPKTELVRETQAVVVFKGPYRVVQGLVQDFKPWMGSLTCTGCPGQARSRGLEGGYCPCHSPLYTGTNCTC